MISTGHLAHYDAVLVGAGIMSATLATLLHQLEPTWRIAVLERLPRVGAESSDAWNNAGTGHAGWCELNYTPMGPDGRIDCTKAAKINAAFERSKQFWAALASQDPQFSPRQFIQRVPHLSFVWGAEPVTFLSNRYSALRELSLFAGLEYSEDPVQLKKWMPLVMAGRPVDEPVAATFAAQGTDVDFGTLTRQLFARLEKQGLELHLQHEVCDLQRAPAGGWRVRARQLAVGEKIWLQAPFVFLGAGGGALTLLDQSDLPEGRGYGGFPVSGQWLVCRNPAVVAQHEAKVYGLAAVGAPPMSVPHLDTRRIDGQKALLFGPFAGFSTKFLKEGSIWDLPRSIDWDNLGTMWGAWMNNLPLTRYLLEQVLQSPTDRLEALREFYPTAAAADWELATAGQRVQVIRRDKAEGGVLEFGTELVTAADGSLAALLGASPGASTAVDVMVRLLVRCFPQQSADRHWSERLATLVPFDSATLLQDPETVARSRAFTHPILGLAE